MYRDRRRRRRRRVEVAVNALLLSGEKIPRSCRVRDFSTDGMQLHWEADEWTSAFDVGEMVDIHFSIRHADGRKKLVIPAVIKRVGDDHVGVAFRDAQPRLLTLLNGYRVEAEPETSADEPQEDAGRETGEGPDGPDAGTGMPAGPANTRRGLGLGLGLAASAAALLVAAWALAVGLGAREDLHALRATVLDIQDRLETPGRGDIRLEELESEVAYLLARVDALRGVVAASKAGPDAGKGAGGRVAALDETARPATGAQGGVVAAPGKPAPIESRSPRGRLREAPPVAEAASSWDVVLISLRSEDSADRLAARARALEIPVEKSRIRSGANALWRLRVPGFASREQARAFAEQVKPKLGLDEVWIVRR